MLEKKTYQTNRWTNSHHTVAIYIGYTLPYGVASVIVSKQTDKRTTTEIKLTLTFL